MTSLETSLGFPVLLSGLDTASQSSLCMGGTGSLDIPEGPHRTQNRTQRLPDLPLLGREVSKDAAWDVGESVDSDFVVVL